MVSWHEDERLADWVDGNLRGKDLERFEAELAVNPELRVAAENYREFTVKLGTALREGTDSPEGMVDRVMAAVGESRTSWWRSPWVGSLAAAAAIVVVFFAIWRDDDVPDVQPVASGANAEDLDRTADDGPIGGTRVDRETEVAGAQPPEAGFGELGRPEAPTQGVHDKRTNEVDGRSIGERELKRRSDDKPGLAESGKDEPVDPTQRERGRMAAKLEFEREAIADADADTAVESLEESHETRARRLLTREDSGDSMPEGAPKVVERVQPISGDDDFFMGALVATERLEIDDQTPVVLLTLPTELASAVRMEQADGKALDEDAARLRLTRQLSAGIVEAPIKATKWTAGAPRVQRVTVGTTATDSPSRKQGTTAKDRSRSKKSRDYVQEARDEVFELRGTREQIGKYLEKLADLVRQNRGEITTTKFEPEALKRAELRRPVAEKSPAPAEDPVEHDGGFRSEAKNKPAPIETVLVVVRRGG